ncbi:hypothetical protein, partial [Okeania sp. SIO1H2]|uniref:hypothetical protein n=1 Tax=Okeania sp. SIO1H2 TaxID=2607775 RepID=UPI00141D330F
LEDSLLVLFNMGQTTFDGDRTYELPVPEGFAGYWTVLFDGDGQKDQRQSDAYAPGSRIDKSVGTFSNQANVLRLRVGAKSLLVLKYSFE